MTVKVAWPALMSWLAAVSSRVNRCYRVLDVKPTAITDLHRRLRCEVCDELGAAEIAARRALGYERVD
jgi:hypothetical protein